MENFHRRDLGCRVFGNKLDTQSGFASLVVLLRQPAKYDTAKIDLALIVPAFFSAAGHARDFVWNGGFRRRVSLNRNKCLIVV